MWSLTLIRHTNMRNLIKHSYTCIIFIFFYIASQQQLMIPKHKFLRSLFFEFQLLGECHCWWTKESPRTHVANFYGRLRLIRSVWRALKHLLRYRPIFARSSTLHFSEAVNTRQKITVHINNLVSSEYPNRSNRTGKLFISILNCT